MPHGEVQCSNEAFPAPEIVERWGSVSERVFSCTKSCLRGKMVLKWGISCTGRLGTRQFGFRKSVFLHQKLPHGKFSAQMRHFLHRKTGYQAVRRQKECFSAQNVTSGGKWCINGAFPAPEIVAQPGSASKRVFFRTKCCLWGKMVHK